MKKYGTESALVLRPFDGGVRKWDIAVGLIKMQEFHAFSRIINLNVPMMSEQ